MLPCFAHHQTSILPSPPTNGVAGGKAHLTSVKLACQSAVKINRVLKLAGRYETAQVIGSQNIFDPNPEFQKAQNLAWETIRNCLQLQWIIYTRDPESIQQSLPSSWIGKGFKNVTFAIMPETKNDLSEQIKALSVTPAWHRMILLTDESPAIHLPDQLGDIDWVVFSGISRSESQASSIENLCTSTQTAFFFHQTDSESDLHPNTENPDISSSSPNHPFASTLQLHRPTLPGLNDSSMNQPQSTTHKENEASSPKDVATTAPTAKNQHIQNIKPSLGKQKKAPKKGMPDKLTTGCNTDQQDFKLLDKSVREELAAFIKVGQALAEIRDRKLWAAGGFENWEAYCNDIGGFSKVHCNRLIKASEITQNILQVEPIGSTCPIVAPRSESQIRPLSKLSTTEEQAQAWTQAVKTADGQPTQKTVSQAVIEITASKVPSTAPTQIKISTKERITSGFTKLREAISSDQPRNNIEDIITSLEKLLKIA